MPEIGPTLRETRMRLGLEISDIEASTKIRAKYLRAIENEEFDLLPGPTFVKSFLRTYAEALGLDARLLMEEYKSRYERFDDQEVRPTPQRGTSHSSSGRERRPPRRTHPGRWILLACAAIVVVIVYSLVSSGDDGPQRKGVTSAVTSTTSTTKKSSAKTTADTTTTAKAPATPTRKTVSLKIVPTGEVYACLFAGKKRLIAGQTLQPGGTPETYKSKRFLVVLGNGNATLDVNGETVKVPQSDKPIGYAITSGGRTRVAPEKLPTC